MHIFRRRSLPYLSTEQIVEIVDNILVSDEFVQEAALLSDEELLKVKKHLIKKGIRDGKRLARYMAKDASKSNRISYRKYQKYIEVRQSSINVISRE